MVRSEVSKKNKYYISKNRFYELRYFCRQYITWKKAIDVIDGYSTNPEYAEVINRYTKCVHGDPTARAAELRCKYVANIELIERIAKETDPIIGNYILHAVSHGLSYDKIRARFDIPCSKDTYYDLYRKFFYLLDIARD